MSSAAKLLKRLALHGSRVAGLHTWVRQSRWRRQRLTILCYHGVSIDDEHRWATALYVSQDFLRRRMQLLASNDCAVLSLDEGLRRLSAGTLPPRSVALTFDDGNADFLLRAYPVLEEFGYPVTVYLSTFYCDRRQPVYGVFWAYLLWKSRTTVLSRNFVGESGNWNLRTSVGRATALADLRNFADANLSANEKDELSVSLAGALGLDYSALLRSRLLQLLDAKEVTQLARKGVDFQLHTHRHRIPDDPTLRNREIHENRQRISALTGRLPEHFCYPSGVYHPAHFQWLRDLNIKSATTCETGMATPWANPLALPRVLDSASLDHVEFESWLSGVGEMLPRRSSRASA